MQVLPPIKEEVDNNIIDDEIESLEEKYKDVSRDCSKHMERLAALMKQKKGFDDLKEKLSSVYPQIEARLSNIHGNGLGKNPERDAKDLSLVKDLKADLIGQDRKLKDLLQSGGKLFKGLNELNMKQKADEVKDAMSEMKEKHEALQGEIGEKEEELSSAVSQQQNLRNRLDGLLRWMSETESTLGDRPLISLEKDKLAQQLKEQRLLNGEIETNKVLLERISEENGQNTSDDDAEGLILELSER
jgi:chromosome segregation ATPase